MIMARYAICFGISDQINQTLRSVPQCANDVKALASFLSNSSANFDVAILIDPTISEMKTVLYETTQKCQSNDELLIFFSGHGRRGRNRKLYLCGTDTNSESLVITGLPFDGLLDILREHSVKSLLIILDCCYSGAAESSFIIKSSDDLLDETVLDSFVGGWTILTSTNSISTTTVSQDMELSPFTDAFLAACKLLQARRSDWITITHIYEELTRRVANDRPKLFGENALYRVCRGHASASTMGARSQINKEIEFHNWSRTYFVFYGMIVLPNFRTWLVVNPPDERVGGAARISDGIDVVSNDLDVYHSEVKKAKQQIINYRNQIASLSALINGNLTLLLPFKIPDPIYRRFVGIDRKYILQGSSTIMRVPAY
jgi:hypothetical protein